MKIADELARETNGSDPRPIPGGFRWSEQNEAAQFTTTSPEYGQKVVIVVSIFADGSAAVDFFGDEGLSGTDRYENIGHFTYSGANVRADIREMVKDIDWVWKTVDGYAASWQEDEGGEVDEAQRPVDDAPMTAPHDPKMKVVFVKNDIHAWVKMPVEYDPRRVRMVDAQHDNMITVLAKKPSRRSR